MNREQFEAQYIAKHFDTALSNKEFTLRQLKKWMADDWMGHKYGDEEIQMAWLEFSKPEQNYSGERPANCRNRLRDEGKAYPRSGCAHCKNGGMCGCPYERA